jgi:hypothetical protein
LGASVKIPSFRLAAATFCLVLFIASPCFSQALSRFGAGAKFSTLGIGIEAATTLTTHSNVRGGFNFMGYNHDFSRSGINYTAQLEYRSVEAHFDWFVGGKFHVSPGLLVYSGNRLTGLANVPGGQSFTLGDQSYFSSLADPVTGTATFDFSKRSVSPMVTAGWGNLISRGDGRFSINVEGGLLFGGSPHATLNLSGNTCVAPSGPCQNIATNSLVQDDIRAEETKFNTGAPPYNQLSNLLKVYPVISIGIGYRIK